jgi:hypothetical protein
MSCPPQTLNRGSDDIRGRPLPRHIPQNPRAERQVASRVAQGGQQLEMLKLKVHSIKHG